VGVARETFPIDRIIRGPAGLHDCAYRTRKAGGTRCPLGGASHRPHRSNKYVCSLLCARASSWAAVNGGRLGGRRVAG